MHLLSPLFHTNSYALALAASSEFSGSTLELAYTSKGDLVSLALALCEIFECVIRASLSYTPLLYRTIFSLNQGCMVLIL